MTCAYIALGANLGEPLPTLRAALAGLARLGEVGGVSRLYRTAPVGGPPGQPDYLNAAAALDTSLAPLALLDGLQALETQAGRTRTVRWEARTLDLDLIVYGTQVLTSARLTVPHPLAWERAFVLAPLADLAPDLRHPVSGETVQRALARTGILDTLPVQDESWNS
ncbi:MAG: 2-amino-4-hydroxy-6-hydroxymethyldihydropteridine diphosphokinase [Deinococcus sp.]|nr:2-amino-4-hydroxy-6-hydroxymethyldihydropteridine diphosphokinase [Deinococcus sp.]